MPSEESQSRVSRTHVMAIVTLVLLGIIVLVDPSPSPAWEAAMDEVTHHG